MASRIFWFLLAGVALIAGIAWQDGDKIFHWKDERAISDKTEQAIEARVERAIERSLDGMQVVGPDGRDIDAPPETKRALSDAIGRLVDAQTDLAFLRMRDSSSREIEEATARRDKARAEIERLKGELERQEQVATIETDAAREQIQREVREDVRDAVRDAVQN